MKIINTLFLPVIFALLALSGCGNTAKKAEQVGLNVDDDRFEYNALDDQFQADYKEYHEQANENIYYNQQRLVEFRSRIKQEKGNAQVLYDRKLACLEAKNNDLKEQLDFYEAAGQNQWESFKAEFDYDMTALTKSFNDLATENAKK